jgi:S1-C subfamily serine protease
LKLGFSPDGYGPSDHAAFYAEDVPVFFISTGAHIDYHTPKDDADLLDYEGSKLVLDYSKDIISELANRDESLTYMEAGPKERQGGGYQFKVTLGIMPDFTGGSDSGLRVDGVRTDGPADKGGMLKGDVIVAMNGMEVLNIYDYMNRLKRLSAGERVAVDVMRDGERIVLLIQL